ncbi:hypothetical protein DXG01_003793 [Tephrocybe rancida]|nr:hypothetical protein DXG01_003793 [Tephrocybe rancida]
MLPISLHHAVIFVTSALAASISAAPSISVKVSGPPAVINAENMKITTTVTNTGDKTLTVLNEPKSPLTSLPADTFKIFDRTGASLAFTGVIAKYAHAAAIDAGSGAVSVLGPGQSVEVDHNLSEAYSFAKEGEYTVVPNNLFHIVNSTKQAAPLYATVDPYITKLTGRLAKVHHVRHPRPSYVNCSTSQKVFLANATKFAEAYALEAYRHLEKNSVASRRYKTWFGADDKERYNTVKDNFKHISTYPNFSSFQYNCSCTLPGTWGYVKPDEFGIVYLCPTFWTLPVKGKESMAGSLVQKSSHFTRNGGAVDYVWTQPLCKELANTNATKAIHNADSYEYFAENDPAV